MAEMTRVDPEDRSSPFEISTHTYKTTDETPILTDVFIPKRIVQDGLERHAENKKLLIMIHLHGGVLVTGISCMVLDLAPELALKHNAFIVGPDHHLLPQATAADILDDLDDLSDFWRWLGHNLGSAIKGLGVGTTIRMGLNRVLVTGESAGGYLAMQLALEHFKPASEPKIRTVVPLYPMIGIRSPHWTTDYEKSIFGVPQLPNSFIDEFIASASKSPKTDRNEWSHCPRFSTYTILVFPGPVRADP